MGECCPNQKQIVLLRNLKPHKAYFVFLHEVIHAINFESALDLTESQVEGLECGIDRLFRLNKIKF